MTNEEIISKIKESTNTNNSDLMLTLYEQNKGLVYTIAKKYTGLAELEDLLNEGYLALVDAVNNYDPEQEAKFSTYFSFWLMNHFTVCARNNQSLHIPFNMMELARVYRRYCESYKAEHGTTPNDIQISNALQITADKLAKVKRIDKLLNSLISLDSYIPDNDGLTLLDSVADPENNIDAYQNEEEYKEFCGKLWELVDSLPENYAKTLRMKYKQNKSYKQIGNELNVSQAKARNTENKALRQLKHYKTEIDSFTPDEVLVCLAYFPVSRKSFQNRRISATERAAFKLMEYEEQMNCRIACN